MEITRATEYAVRCILHLALELRGRVVPRREIARAREIPEQFLGKIAQRLARAGIVRIHQGARGGYELIAPPGRVTLLEVVEAGEGPLALNKCVMHPKSCPRTCICAAHRVWSEARRQLRETLARATFADLAAQEGRPPSPDGVPAKPPPRAERSRGRGGAGGRAPAERAEGSGRRKCRRGCSGTRSDRGPNESMSARRIAAREARERMVESEGVRSGRTPEPARADGNKGRKNNMTDIARRR